MTPEDVFLDVRKAYRLLHDYQRMVLDVVNYIGNQLGLTYSGGWSKFSNPAPRNGRGELGNWSWDWLNMVQYEFHFERQLVGDEPLQFSVLLISDTGYFCSQQENASKTDLGSFLPVVHSQTKIAFIMSAKQWPDPAFMENKEEMKVLIESENQLPAEYSAAGLVAKCCNLARLLDEKSTQILIEELIAVANSAKIPLGRVNPNVN